MKYHARPLGLNIIVFLHLYSSVMRNELLPFEVLCRTSARVSHASFSIGQESKQKSVSCDIIEESFTGDLLCQHIG
jgi:hypothetical protein